MKSRFSLKECCISIVSFLLGAACLFVVGISVAFAKSEESKPLRAMHTFGSLRILPIIEDPMNEKDKTLMIERHGHPIVLIDQLRNKLWLFNGREAKPIVTMFLNPDEDKWYGLKYGSMSKDGGNPENGSTFLDDDLDGQIDLVFHYIDSEVSQITTLIDLEWKEVDSFNFKTNIITIDGDDKEISMHTSQR